MQKAMLKPETVGAYIRIHERQKIPYTLTMSNYTTRIQSAAYNIHFLKNVQSNRVFAAYNKIKKDCLRREMPKISKTSLRYFDSKFFESEMYFDQIYNIDMKAAYATVLFRDGYITEETYKYVMSLKKMERLAAVGMLAGKKTIYKIDADGKVQGMPEVVISPTSDYFFYCVKRTNEIIGEVAREMYDDFLFYWVDGIYFLSKDPEKYYSIFKECFFEKRGFPCTFEKLKEFHIKPHKTHFQVSYLKEGKKKIINVPRPENETIKKLTDYLTTKDYSK